MKDVTLITVATPGVYRQYADQLRDDAILRFNPTGKPIQYLILPGVEGPWPTATITRPQVMLEHWHRVEGDYVFCIDADMRIERLVGGEVLGELVATEHPGYVGRHCTTVPYERNEISKCFVPMGQGDRYFAGGFYGGERDAVLDLIDAMSWRIETDLERIGRIRWNDESALNASLLETPPTVTLSPAYCHPDRDESYREWWPEDYPRVIVALDKDNETRGDRGDQQ